MEGSANEGRTENGEQPSQEVGLWIVEKLLVGATGAIGVTTLPHFLMMARGDFARQVRVIMSEGAKKFLSPYVAHLYSGTVPVTDLFTPEPGALVPHIDITESADLLVILPASADILAKAAYGFADDAVSTTILAAECPIVFVPSMNEAMWRKAVVQENIARLRSFGYHVLEPSHGTEIATMEPAFGEMPPFDEVFDFLRALSSGASSEAGGETEPSR
jgi:phosphopantothenoylcysteine decarboxylase